MASRPTGYGLTAETSRKIASKYDKDLASDVVQWIAAVIGEPVGADVAEDGKSFCTAFKDGKMLCKLINTIQPGSVKKVNDSKMAFKMMENIGQFLSACEKYGVHQADMFQTVDLYESQNPVQVVNGLYALGRKTTTKGWDGPCIGPKESDKNVREFTEEQMKAGQGVIGLQMGTNKGASQAGMTFGKARMIND